MAGIYVHIPFCRQACHYCDFHFSTGLKSIFEMTRAIAKELILQKDYLEREQVETIYLGGGTPSLLPKEQLLLLLNTIYEYFDVNKSVEITLEANPDDLSIEKLEEIRKTGFNRLSIGVQSFHDDHLSYLNRTHNSQVALEALSNSRKVGIENISIDLIYGIPSDNHTKWLDDLEQALLLSPSHISSYCLTIEDKTTFGNWLKKGKIKSINDEYAAEQFEKMIKVLCSNGYEHYEISNFAYAKKYSLHNTNYWKQRKYLGVGPSAHSYSGVHRQYNIDHNKKYVESVNKGVVPLTMDYLSTTDHINEYLLTTLRTMWGADLGLLIDKYNYDIIEIKHGYISNLIGNHQAYVSNNHLILTNKGKLLADSIASDLFLT